MTNKDAKHKQKKVQNTAQEQSGTPYQLVYETSQGQDVEVQVTTSGSSIYTIDTPWYRASVRTNDVLDTIVRFCQALFGTGKLTVILG